MTRDEATQAIHDLVYSSHRCTIDIERITNRIYDEFEAVGSELVRENTELKERLESFKKLTYSLVSDVEEVLYED